jgi:hypothetical protein
MKNKPSKEQIEQWKKEHGELFHYQVGEKFAILKKPSRKTISYASVAAQTDPMKYNDIILQDCWVAGDEEIKTDTGLFLSISAKLSELVGIVEVEVVKL